MTTAAELLLVIRGDTQGVDAALDGASSKASNIGKVLAGAGIGAAAGTAASAIVGIGTAFDDAYDGIQIATGATGAELDGLQQSFRDVVSAVPVDFETASAAIGTLYQKLDITGEPLDTLAIQMANLSRMTGTDVVANSNAAAEAISKFGIDANDAGGFVDALFARSQQSGMSFDELAGTLASSAGQLQTLGLSAADSAGLVATLEEAGVNTGAVLKGVAKFAKDGGESFKDLEKAQADVAKAGEKVAQAEEAYGKATAKHGEGSEQAKAALEKLTAAREAAEEENLALARAEEAVEKASGPMIDQFSAELETLKNLGPGTDQTRRAMELFGTKAGPELATALNEGILSVDDLRDNMGPVEQGINDTASSTDDLQQKFDLLKNKAMLAAEGFAPMGMALAPVSGMLPMLGSGLGAAVPLLGSLGGVITGTVVPAVVTLAAPFLPIIIAVGAVIAIVAALKYAWDHNLGGIQEKVAAVKEAVAQAWDNVKAKFGELKDWIVSHKDMIVNALLLLTGPIGALVILWREKSDEIKAAVQDVVDRVTQFVDDVRAKFEDVKAAVSEKIQAIATFLTDKWNEITTNVTTAVENVRVMISAKWDAIKEFLDAKIEAIRAFFEQKWAAIKGLVTDTVEGIRSIIEAKIEAARDIVDDVLADVQAIFQRIWDAVSGIVETALNLISDTIERVITGWKLIIERALKIADWLWDIITGAVERVKSALGWIVDNAIRPVIEGWRTIVQTAFDVAGWLADAVTNAVGKIKAVGASIIDGLKEGIATAMTSFTSWFGDLFGDPIAIAKRILGISSPSRVFRVLGEQTVEGYALGFRSAWGGFAGEAASDVSAFVREVAGVVLGQSGARGATGAQFGFGFGRPWGFGGASGMGAAVGRAFGAFGTDADLQAGLGAMAGVAYQSLLAYIRSASFGSISQAQLAEWMRRMGYDEETIADYRDLHRMREGGKWKTREAMWLHRRRTILTHGWTGNEDGLTRDESKDWWPYLQPGAGASKGLLDGLAGGGPVDVRLRGGHVEGDVRVTEPVIVRVTIGAREIDMIATEVLRKLNVKLIAKPITPTP